MKKRSLAIFLALVMVLALLPAAALAADNGMAIQNGVLVKYTGSGGAVTIPNGVTSIGKEAFCLDSTVTSVTIPGSVTSIGESAFKHCENLTGVTISEGVTSIGTTAFYYCSSLTSVTIPASVTSIGASAFYGCTALTDVYYSGTAAQWSALGVSNDNGNGCLATATLHTGASAPAADSDFTFENGVLTKYNGSGGAVAIPSGVTSIGDGVFQDNTSITSVSIPNGVTTIGEFAFQNCTNLTRVSFPSSLTTIKERAFYCCSSLTGVTFPGGLSRIESCAFFDCVSLKSLVIPNSVTHLGERSFQGCKNMTDVTFEPGGANLILTHGTFAYCTSLSEVNLSDRITVIGGTDEGYWGNGYVFTNSTGLQSIVIPKSVTLLDTHCFEECTGLTSITILNPNTQISDNVFLKTGLRDVYYAGSEAMWNAMSIDTTGNGKLLNASIHYNATGPASTAPVDPIVVPDTGEAGIQDAAIQDGKGGPDWVDRLELPGYAEELYDTISGTEKQDGVFEDEKNFALPKASTAPAVTKVERIEVAEFSLLDLYANPGAELNSAIFSDESFYTVAANAEDQRIDCAKLNIGDFISTANFNGVYVTKIPYDSAFDTKKTEACEYIAAVYHAFDRDHPEIFWLSGKCKARVMVTTDPGSGAKEAYFFLVLADKDGFTMRAPAWTAAGSMAAGIARRDAAVTEILKTVTAADTASKIRQLNKWITEHNQYNTTPDLNTISNEPHESLAALCGQIGTEGPVCDGYSRAFKVLCDKLGIPCVLETGWARATASGAAEFHMWSLVQVGGTWYGADITWDDPSVKGIIAAKSGRENEKYLLVGSNTVINGLTFAQSHVVKNQAAVGGVDFNNGPVMGLQAYSGMSDSLPTVENIPAAGTAYARTQTVKLDGKSVTFQCYAVKNAAGNETNYIKVRDLANELNGTQAQFNVGWDGKISITSNTAYKVAGGEGSTPYSGNQPYKAVSGTPVSFNGGAVNLTSFQITHQGNGYTYYKLRDLGQLLNFNVGWSADQGMFVETNKPYDSSN